MSAWFQLEHIGLAARDPRALKEWYARVLDAELVLEIEGTPPAYLLKLGGLMLEIYSAHRHSIETENNRLAGWRHVALKVSSIELGRDILQKHGVVFNEPIKPAGGGGRVLFFSDLEGNLLHLTERLPGGLTSD